MDPFAKRIAATSVVGLLLSVYALWVETRVGQLGEENAYNAMCDISERVSCSKVFHSRYVEWEIGIHHLKKKKTFLFYLTLDDHFVLIFLLYL